jgi:GNAT superfamily N-acetyltransferase
MSDEYEIREIGIGDEDIATVFPIINQLRDHLDLETFKRHYLAMYDASNYRILTLRVGDDVRAAAGFRWILNLAAGNSLYIDDLVTADAWRSKGYGGVLVKYLGTVAEQSGADAIRLDSATHRTDAHRFYEREGFSFVSKSFARRV